MEQLSGSNIVKVGIDLSEFYLSVEWDILAVPASRNEEYYPCCTEPYSGNKQINKIKSPFYFLSVSFLHFFLGILIFL